jgi:putative nucleotidyltransferase with HDIG domain
MADKQDNSRFIAADQLCVGLYVCLDLGWLNHDFPLSSFKIKNGDQIKAISKLGLKKIRIDPSRSDVPPLPQKGVPVVVVAPLPPPSAEQLLQAAERAARHDRIRQQRAETAACENQFVRAAGSLKEIGSKLFSRPLEARASAEVLIDQMLTSILAHKDIAIHLMNDKTVGEDLYFHALNVSVLAMLLGREVGLPAEDIRQLGIGCIFHDVGKIDIPDRVLQKSAPYSRAERNLIEQHCAYGEPIGQRLGLSVKAMDILRQHHEHCDGSGYPAHLKGPQIAPLARLVAIVNEYDNLCNQPNPADSLSPHEALSHLFTQQRGQFDTMPLNLFIRCMGIYPPGTVVQLSDGTLGMVVSVNASQPLRPWVLIYDPAVPKDEATILDLQYETTLNVAASLKPSQLSREVHAYLSPRKRMTVYFDAQDRPVSGAGR